MRILVVLFTSLSLFLGCQTLFLPRMERFNCSIKSQTISDDNFIVEATLYGRDIASDRAVILLPPTGGTNLIDRSYAKALCLAGFDVLILDHWTGEKEVGVIDYELHHRFYSRATRAVGLALSSLPHPFVGLLGTSVGGTFAAVVANQFEKLDALFVIVGGAPLPEVIVHSDQKAMQDLREQRYKKYHLQNDDQYLREIDKVFPLDPFKTAPLYKNKTLGMIISTIDTTVPFATQLKLRDLWKPKTVYELHNGHFIAIVKSWLFYQNKMVQFFIDAADGKSVKK